MRPIATAQLESYRAVHPTLGDSSVGAMYGYFVIHRPHQPPLRVISTGFESKTDGWEHVSVSLAARCPTWDEMCMVKDLFWTEEELVLQFHPPRKNYVNQMAFCLHLWKSPEPVRLPPLRMV